MSAAVSRMAKLWLFCGIISNYFLFVFAEDIVTCVYTSWSATRRPIGRVAGGDLPGQDCTHLVYTYTSIYDNKLFTLQPMLDDKANGGMGNIAKFNALKNDNPNLKTLIGVGGWTAGGWIFSTTFSTPEGRREFIESVIDFCANNDLDGIFIDWLTPGVEVRGGSVDDKVNFASLLSDMRDMFDENAKSTGKKLLLTLTVSAAGGYLANYDVDAVNRAADIVYLISYDLSGYWNGTIMHPSALFNEEGHASVDGSVQMWIQAGLDASKMVMGIPAFARTYKIDTKAVQPSAAYGTNFTGDGTRGAISQAPGFLYYGETCARIEIGHYTIVRDELMRVPYAYNNQEMIMYDDEQSVAEKVKYAKDNGLGGVYLFSTDEDDPKGFCGTQFPLTLAASSAMASGGKYNAPGVKVQSVKRCVSGDKTCQKPIDCLVYPTMTYANDSADLWCGQGVTCEDPVTIVECPLPDSILQKGDPFQNKATVQVGSSASKMTSVKCRPSITATSASDNVSYICVSDGILGKSIQEFTCPAGTKFTSLYLKCVSSGQVILPAR